MISVIVTYDSQKFKWVIYGGWTHYFEGSADECDKWLNKNSDKFVEVK